jgi:hypothetical protein
MIFSSARAEITWTTPTEFYYNTHNLSQFFYPQQNYLHPVNQSVTKEDLSDQYNSVAEIQDTEYQDIPETGSILQINAMAMGPQGGSDPPNGTMVRAFLKTVPRDLTINRDQISICRPSAEQYSVSR